MGRSESSSAFAFPSSLLCIFGDAQYGAPKRKGVRTRLLCEWAQDAQYATLEEYVHLNAWALRYASRCPIGNFEGERLLYSSALRIRAFETRGLCDMPHDAQQGKSKKRCVKARLLCAKPKRKVFELVCSTTGPPRCPIGNFEEERRLNSSAQREAPRSPTWRFQEERRLHSSALRNAPHDARWGTSKRRLKSPKLSARRAKASGGLSQSRRIQMPFPFEVSIGHLGGPFAEQTS